MLSSSASLSQYNKINAEADRSAKRACRARPGILSHGEDVQLKAARPAGVSPLAHHRAVAGLVIVYLESQELMNGTERARI